MNVTGPRHALPDRARVVNVGLPLFADAVAAQGADVVQVDWRPPANGDPAAVRALTELYGPRGVDVDAANAEVLRRLDRGTAFLVDVRPAIEVVPRLSERTLLHPGPPGAWDDMCDPLRRSMRAAVVAEGWTSGIDAAQELLASGGVELAAANEHHAVLPMATALGPSMPVWVVENRDGGTRAFAPIGQGPGDVAWYGRESTAAVGRLVFLRDVAAPILTRILAELGPVDVFAYAAQGVQMGDDVHMRTQATTNLLIRAMLPVIARHGREPNLPALAEYLSGNHLFFLTIAMAGAKSLTMWAEQVTGSSIVTSMARNGTTYGIRLAGRDEWYVTEAPTVADALFYPGYGPSDAARDIGDSAVLELVGLGGAAAAGSPAVAAFLGGSMSDAIRATEEMARICATESSRFKLPIMGFRGTPLGVDVRRVVETGTTPKVTTGILHVDAGHGQIGAGVATAPLAGFQAALLALSGG